MPGRGEASWEALCQIGVTGLGVPEQYGGAGGLIEAHVVLEELERVLAPVPMLRALLATQAFLLGGNPSECERLLSRIADGTITAAVMWAPAIPGVVPHVLDGDTADVLRVSTPDGLFLAR
jgi:alkylation response protein AidB-like acyl-CoA dehydrogenase